MDCTTEVVVKSLVVHSPSKGTFHNEFSAIDIYFKALDMDSDGDWLEISTEGNNSLIRLTGDTPPCDELTIYESSVFIHFHSDATTTAGGFQLSLLGDTLAPHNCSCPPKMAYGEMKGRIHSVVPGSCRYLNCFTKIQLDKSLTSNFTSRQLSTFPHHFYASVHANLVDEKEWILFSVGVIHEDNEQQTNLSRRDFVSGARRSILFDELGADPFVMVWYHREGDMHTSTNRSIDIQWAWVERCACGPAQLKVEEGHWGLLNSPDFPHPYCNSMDCEYTISAPDGHRLLLNVSFVDLEDGFDLLDIYDYEAGVKPIETLTGYHYEPVLIFSQSRSLTLSFQTDATKNGHGFTLSYTAERMEEGAKSTSYLLIVLTIFAVVLITLATLVCVTRNPAAASWVEGRLERCGMANGWRRFAHHVQQAFGTRPQEASNRIGALSISMSDLLFNEQLRDESTSGNGVAIADSEGNIEGGRKKY